MSPCYAAALLLATSATAFNLTWTPTYNMSESTLINPDGNLTGYDADWLLDRDAKYGIITFDWNDRRCVISQTGPPDDPCKYRHDVAGMQVQAANIHAKNPRTHVFTYRNMEQAISMDKQYCEKMVDPAYDGFFLKDPNTGLRATKLINPPAASVCSSVASASAYQPLPISFVNWNNQSAVDWWLNEYLGDLLRADGLDGMYWDMPFMETKQPALANFTTAELAELEAILKNTLEVGQAMTAKANKSSLQMLSPITLPDNCQPSTCTRSWKQSFNCTCDYTPSAVMSRVKHAQVEAMVPSRMGLPFVPDNQLPDAAACDAPAAVTAVGSPYPMSLSCLPGTGTMTIDFASLGLPTVSDPAAGRFIKCVGDGCVSGGLLWEDTTAHTVHPVIPGSECDHCEGHACQAASVPSSYIESLTPAAPFNCRNRRDCTAFAANSTCDAGPAVLQHVKALCDGKQSCKLEVTNETFAMPKGCPAGSELVLAVRASGCSAGHSYAGFREHLATFLLTRGSHSWMGYGWTGGAHPPEFYPDWEVDYGEPMGDMQVAGSMVWREWTNFNITLDTETYTAEFVPKA